MRSFITGGGGRRALPLCFLAFAVLLAPPGAQPLRGQTVQGQLLNRETMEPVEGALVLLLGPQGEEHDGYLTNAAGRFILRAPGPGTYVVRADRIGYETSTSEAFTLSQSQIFGLRMEIAETAIQLAELRVEGEQQCVVRPEEGMDLARVWEEAQKALTVQEWTEREGMYRFQVVNYERDMDRDARQIKTETRRVSDGVARSPIRSLPADELMSEGFIQRSDDGGWTYYGPDATVLLSDEFLDTHCFHLRFEQEDAGILGLAFEPARTTNLSDIEGTLWLDRETAALRFLEFGYTGSSYEETRGVARGRVDFEELPNGAWIIRKWWIRMPQLAQDMAIAREGRSGIYVAGFREAGGEVTRISTLDRREIAQSERGFLSGLVWDSTRYGPLAGANVYLSGTSYSAVSNAEGRFLMEDVPEGVFTAAFTHPRLDTLGVLAGGVEVEITPGNVSEVLLGVPAMGSILLEACRGEERRRGSSVIFGVVRDQASGEPIPGATVRLDWQEVDLLGPGKIGGQNKWFEASTNGEGRYTVCDAPGDRLIIVQATFLDRQSDTVHVRVPEDSYAVVNLSVGLPPGLFRSGSGSRVDIPAEGAGVQGVQGYVLESESGQPVRDAEITLRQTPGPVRVTGTTDNRGFFRLQTRFPGTFAFSAQALGYAGIQDETVEVQPGKLTVLEVQMAPEALELAPLLVTAEARTFHLEMEGFYERQTKSLDTGIFFDPETIEARMPNQVTDLFFGMMGTRVVETVVGGRGVYFRSGERPSRGGIGICWPMVYLDRQLIRTGGLDGDPAALDEIAEAFDVAAIEVYRTPAEIPPAFNGPNAGCGVIVLWTRRGGSGGIPLPIPASSKATPGSPSG
jgi:hypothetical protein